MKRLSLVVVLALGLSACGRASFKLATKGLNSTDKTPVVSEKVPACEIDVPQMAIQGFVNAFEMKGGVGVQVGYDRGGGFGNIGGSVKLQVQTAQMALTFVGLDPLSGAMIAAGEVGSNQTNTKIGAEVDFSLIKVNPDFFFQTPIGKVTHKGLELGVGSLEQQMESASWLGRVLKQADESTLILNSGSLHGVKIGDIFDVYNVKHDWAGTACKSEHLGSRRVDAGVSATVQVVSVGANSSYATILQANANSIRPGAEVEIRSLYKASPKEVRSLKKKVILDKINARDFQIPGNARFDLERAMNSQILEVIKNSKFVLSR